MIMSSELHEQTDFAGGMGGLQAMGVLGALRTGDAKVDLILAMCLPFVIRFLINSVRYLEVIVKSSDWFNRQPMMHYRLITYRMSRSMYGGSSNLDEDSQNRVLQKAIKLYLHSEVKLALRTAETNLTAMSGKGALSSNDSYGYYGNSSNDDDDETSRTVVGILSKYKIVQSPPKDEWHSIGCYGTEQLCVELQITHSEDQGSEKSTQKTSTLEFNFRSMQGSAIDDFIDTAYNWYLGELKQVEDHSRYLYELKSGASSVSTSNDNDDDDGGTSRGNVYKRYRLSEEKTFESLFFKQKASLLSLIENFQERKGKYAIKGYPHKLGLLLFGPPGSGKTSLIKALAQHTGRSVINVPLARVKTNAELMSIFYDSNLRVDEECVPVKMRFKDIIFVIEDVDAASKIVKRRDGKKTAGTIQTDRFEVLQTTKSLWHMLLESRNDNCKSLVQELIEKSDRLKFESQNPEVLRSAAERMLVFPGISVVGEAGDNPILHKVGVEAVSSANELMDQFDTVDRFLGMHSETIKTMLESGVQVDTAFEDALLGISSPKSFPPPLATHSREREVSYSKYTGEEDEVHLVEASSSTSPSEATSHGKNGSKVFGPSLPISLKSVDELNLQGVLNVLDGVVDSPGRIVIMTTNHPEQLDPALIRPGRIDKKLLLGYMDAPEMMDMLEHYFQTKLTDEQRQRITRILSGIPPSTQSRLRLTPAQVEQMTAEYDDIADMINALEEKGHPLVPRKNFPIDHTKSALAYDL